MLSPSSGTESTLLKYEYYRTQIFYPEDGGSRLICNVGTCYQNTQFHIPENSKLHIPVRETHISHSLLLLLLLLVVVVVVVVVAQFQVAILASNKRA